MHNLLSKILFRFKRVFNQINNNFDDYVNLKMSRNEAKRFRKKAILKNGKTVVDQNLLREIKLYCRNVLGSSSYWPWLACYTELKGEFKGWMPDDYYLFELLPKMNQEKFMRFSEAKVIDHKRFG